jgi:hypothetical protein
MLLKGELRSQLGFLHRDLCLDALYPFDARQVVDLKPSIVIKVGRDDAKNDATVPASKWHSTTLGRRFTSSVK